MKREISNKLSQMFTLPCIHESSASFLVRTSLRIQNWIVGNRTYYISFVANAISFNRVNKFHREPILSLYATQFSYFTVSDFVYIQFYVDI